jgi:hypothetical protein
MRPVVMATPRVIFTAATAVAISLAPAIAVCMAPDGSAPRAVAQDDCSSSGTMDSYSLQCVPNMVPDFSDHPTEAEVAEPGFNATPGGGAHR